MKTTIDLPDDLVREVKLRAVMQGRTLREFVTDFIRQGLGMPALNTPPDLAGSKVVVGTNGLPVIVCHADAPATGMSAEDLLELEQRAQSTEDIRLARRRV